MKPSRRTSVLSGHLCAGGTANLLTAEEIGRYHTDGYVVPANFCLPSTTIDLIKAQHAQLIKTHPKFTDYCPGLLPYDLGFLNFARDPAILGMVEQLIGEDIVSGERT